MTAPLLTPFDVACSAEHAFHVWTDRIGTWWPPDHTATGQADHIVLESGVGGRIYERTSDGVEHDWGEVTVWEPPARLVYQNGVSGIAPGGERCCRITWPRSRNKP